MDPTAARAASPSPPPPPKRTKLKKAAAAARRLLPDDGAPTATNTCAAGHATQPQSTPLTAPSQIASTTASVAESPLLQATALSAAGILPSLHAPNGGAQPPAPLDAMTAVQTETTAHSSLQAFSPPVAAPILPFSGEIPVVPSALQPTPSAVVLPQLYQGPMQTHTTATTTTTTTTTTSRLLTEVEMVASTEYASFVTWILLNFAPCRSAKKIICGASSDVGSAFHGLGWESKLM